MATRPSKDKRQRQNRQERAARAARSARAGEATAIARGEREPVRTEPKPAAGAKAAPKGRRKRRSPYTEPGQRAVVMSLLFAIVSAATLLLAPIQVERQVPADDPRAEEVEDPEVADDGTVTIIEEAKIFDEEGAAIALGVMLTPIVITAAAVAFTKRPQRSTAWTIAMVALSAYIFLFAGPYGIITLPSLIAVAIGNFQSRKADNAGRMAEIRARKAAGSDAAVDGTAVEGTVVEGTVLDEEVLDAEPDEDEPVDGVDDGAAGDDEPDEGRR